MKKMQKLQQKPTAQYLLGLFHKYYNSSKYKQQKKEWHKEMYEKRVKNFFTSFIYIAVCVFFIFIGHLMKNKFFNIVYYYIWMSLLFIFLLLGIITMLPYLWIILKAFRKK